MTQQQAVVGDNEGAALRLLSRQFPTLDSAVAEVARLSGGLMLPKGTVHVVSDIHGDDVKLRHVINNASGSLRPLLEKLFKDRLPAKELQELITLIFYPREMIDRLRPGLKDVDKRRQFSEQTLKRLFEVIRTLANRYSLRHVTDIFPKDYRPLLEELLFERPEDWGDDGIRALIHALVGQERDLVLIRLTVRAVRDLFIQELVVAGDFWDRGPRGDRVLARLIRQPNVAITWGNHDAAWQGACLGHEACIAHVLRISLRYRRLSQLEEGYGITLQPLEHLVRTVYGDDPAESYPLKGTGLREAAHMRRMQKAAAVMQFKLEGQMIERNPHFGLNARRLLHQLDLQAGTVGIEGVTYPLRDKHFPTIDPARPYELSADERACMDRTRESFLASNPLYDHIKYMVERGSMWLVRDDHLIFHACVPCDAQGEFLPFEVDGVAYKGRALFDALEKVVVRTLDRPQLKDLDLLWYLWCGPLSPLFGKDKIATFENDLVADPKTHVETKNPYFQLIHEVDFCDKVMREFGVDPARGLIVNGHVPVKIDKGENPLKRSGKAITIDGAFSQAYGDHGYTLVLEPGRTYLAKHHHFESVEAAVRDGVDIIPEITELRRWEPARRVADTEAGDEHRAQIALLYRLIDAYRHNRIKPR
ncbi:MAG: fructose-bisphosphatase class III [Gemmataceae bacterium]